MNAKPAIPWLLLLAFALAACGGGGGDDPRPADPGPSCGDGVLDPGEACEPSLAPGACRADCTVPRCGDGVVDAGEGCDDGAGNDDLLPDACRTDCAPARCGDSVIDGGEGCDDGAGNGDAPDACRAGCVAAACGDGIRDSGEGCDEGVENDDARPDACRTDCSPARCGDGVTDAGEPCDDGAGNGDAPDACRAGCVAPTCGDGVQDTGEGCDEGAENDDARPDACRTDCAPARCGDAVTDAGEGCDDGAANSDTAADACRTDCGPARCGDGVIDTGEPCDDGAGNGDAPDACRAGCVAPTCGDGVQDGDEGCDTGSARSDTEPGACRLACVAAGCGDAVIDPGEGCDDGANNSDAAPNACRTDCRPARCGDGVRDGLDEECDDGNTDDNDRCTSQCKYGPDGWGWTKAGVVFELPAGTTQYSSDQTPALIAVDGTLHLYFMRARKLNHATSADGITFTAPVPVTGVAGTSQSEPTLLHDGSAFRLWVKDGTNKFSAYTSTDGAAFTLGTSSVLPRGTSPAFDFAMIAYPSVTGDAVAGYRLWYTGFNNVTFQIGTATSADGIAWTKNAANPVLSAAPAGSFDNTAVAMPRVLAGGPGYRMWYGGYDTSRTTPGPWRIGYAESADGVSWDKKGVSIPLAAAGTDAWATREPAVAYFNGGWVMVYAGLGDDNLYRLHRAVSSHAP